MAEGKKKLSKIDEWQNSWDSLGLKQLSDLFAYEEKGIKEIADLRAKLRKKLTADERKETQNKLDEIEKAYKNLYKKIEDEALSTITKEQARRLEGYQEEIKEYEAFLKTQSKISDRRKADLSKKEKKAKEIEESIYQKREERKGKEDLKRARKQILEESRYTFGGVGSFGQQAVASLSESFEHGLKQIGKAFADISNKINSTMDTYSKYQSTINTRLQGTNLTFSSIETTLKRGVGATPYIKTENMLNNLQSLVEAGIVSNIEQRAFLQTVKEKIADTFDAANSSLLRIIRLQQNDSTAARLGMEAYLTRFLNTMVENTEYLSTTFDSVQSALLEASSIMTTAASTEFEYTVQKWLGTLVGRGLSESTANSLASALGMLGSGNISGLSGNAINNLLVMAASRSGINYSDILTEGLSANTANALLTSLVKYMQEINASGNNVVRSQYAQTFGLNISDLMAASNIGTDLKAIADNLLDYNSMFSELNDQMNKIQGRTHISEAINNLFENAQFSLASNIASNPVLASIWKVTDMIQGVTGGINIPAISAMGNMIDLETTVENLMKLGLVGAGSLGMIGDVVTGLSSVNNFSKTLSALNINQQSAVLNTSGKSIASRSSGLSTSILADTVVNSDTADIQEQTLNQAKSGAKKEQQEGIKEADNPASDIRSYILDVFASRFNTLVDLVAANNGFENNVDQNAIISIDGKSYTKANYQVSMAEDNEQRVNLLATIKDDVSEIRGNIAQITESVQKIAGLG